MKRRKRCQTLLSFGYAKTNSLGPTACMTYARKSLLDLLDGLNPYYTYHLARSDILQVVVQLFYLLSQPDINILFSQTKFHCCNGSCTSVVLCGMTCSRFTPLEPSFVSKKIGQLSLGDSQASRSDTRITYFCKI